MEALGKGGMVICGVNNRVKMFSFNSFRQFYYRQEKGIPLFRMSPFRIVCSKSSHFSMIMGKPGSNGTKRNSQPAAGVSSQVIGNDKLGGKDSKSIFSSVVGLVTQRVIQKNYSCFEIQEII